MAFSTFHRSTTTTTTTTPTTATKRKRVMNIRSGRSRNAVSTTAAAATAVAALISSACTAFIVPKANRGHIPIPYTGVSVTRTSLIAATLEQPPTINRNSTEEEHQQPPTLHRINSTKTIGATGHTHYHDESQDSLGGSWDCPQGVDGKIECKQVPECDAEGCRTSLDVRIHGEWFDLTGWRKRHPAGSHWIDWYDGRDATEVMDAFHSEKGRQMYKRLPRSKKETSALLEPKIPKDSPTQLAFRELRNQLEKDGWWKRDMKTEYTIIGIWGGLVAAAALVTKTAPLVSTFLLGLSMTAAGWLGHDYIHGVDPFTDKLRNFAAVAAGLLPVWWSDKHNKHHAVTNEIGCDEDIATDPFLYQSVPNPESDSPIRRIQHWIFFIPFSALFALWRFDSIKVAISSVQQKRPGSKNGLYSLIVHYAWLLGLFPHTIWIPAIFMSGLVSALIVTPTHQSEEMFTEYQADWVTAQFQSTRNAVATNPFSEWLWGGMQYQLEHHLFPSMPRSKYPKLKKILQKFAIDNKIPGGYRESGEFEILWMNWKLYRKIAHMPADTSALNSRGYIGQQAGIMESENSPAAAQGRRDKAKAAAKAKKKEAKRVATPTAAPAMA